MTKSYAAIRAEFVIEMANAALDNINKLRCERWDSYIEKRLLTLEKRWYRRLFRMRPPTADDVMRHDSYLPKWDSVYHRILYWDYTDAEKVAKELLVAANIASKYSPTIPMKISADDLYILMVSKNGEQ